MDWLIKTFLWLKYDNSSILERKKQIRNRSIIMIISCGLLLLFVATSVLLSYLNEDNIIVIIVGNITINGGMMKLLLWSLLIFFSAALCYSIGIKNYWGESVSNLSLERYIKEEFDELKNIKIKTISKDITDLINDKYNKLRKSDSTRCNKCEKHGASWGLLTCGLMKYDSHKSFIDDLVKTNAVQRDQMERIKNDFEKASYAKLLCILSNPQYFETNDENKLKALTDYFISFYPVIKSRQSRIKRIFSFSTVKNSNDNIDNKKCQWLLQYLIINMITGVETYLLFDENELTCVHIDYVIGKYDNGNQMERILYVSYEPDGISKTNKDVAICHDHLLTNIVDRDFYDRLYGKMSDGNVRNNIELSRKNIDNLIQVVEKMCLTKENVVDAFNILTNNINNCHQQGVTKDIRKELLTEFQSVKNNIINMFQ